MSAKQVIKPTAEELSEAHAWVRERTLIAPADFEECNAHRHFGCLLRTDALRRAKKRIAALPPLPRLRFDARAAAANNQA